MTGKAILEALSFVDEAYIEEAENEIIRPALQIKKILPLAACLCILVLGLFSLDDLLPKQETAAPDAEMQVEAMPEIIEMDKAQSEVNSECELTFDGVEIPSVTEMPATILRIEKWTDTGFVGTIEELMDLNPDSVKIGNQLHIVLSENTVYQKIVFENSSVLTNRVPTEEELPVGSIVLVQYFAFYEETFILYVDWITSDLREWRD